MYDALYSMNVCGTNVIWMYYIWHVVIVSWPTSISCDASLPFTNSLLCPSYAHFRTTPEVVGHPGTFCILYYEVCGCGHTSFDTYCFHLPYSMEVCNFEVSSFCFILINCLHWILHLSATGVHQCDKHCLNKLDWFRYLQKHMGSLSKRSDLKNKSEMGAVWKKSKAAEQNMGKWHELL